MGEITLPIAPDVPPVIFSPLTKVPDCDVKVKTGAIASALVLSESKIAPILNASALPKLIVLSVALVPNAAATAPATLTCLERLVVFNLCVIFVFNTVAVNLTLAAFPKFVLSVIVIVDEPVPLILLSAETTSPWEPEPDPAVSIVNVKSFSVNDKNVSFAPAVNDTAPELLVVPINCFLIVSDVSDTPLLVVVKSVLIILLDNLDFKLVNCFNVYRLRFKALGLGLIYISHV